MNFSMNGYIYTGDNRACFNRTAPAYHSYTKARSKFGSSRGCLLQNRLSMDQILYK